VVKPSHLDTAMCLRTLQWTVQGHLHIRRHDLGKFEVFVTAHLKHHVK
jgi:hypothetical protein